MARILVTRSIPKVGIDTLRLTDHTLDYREADSPIGRDEFLARLAQADAAIVMLTDKIDPAALAVAPNLKIVANFAAGSDNLNIPAMTGAGVWASNTPDVLTEATADLTWALLLAVARRVREGDNWARSGKWAGWGPLQMLGWDVTGTTIGIIGAGRIGTAVARRALGFAMNIIYAPTGGGRTSVTMSLAVPTARCLPLEDVIEQSDFLCLHCPLVPETRHLINADRLSRMKDNAIIINAARGPVIDEEALADALAMGSIAGAGLDVHEFEPKVNERLAKMESVVVLPHLGSATRATRDAMSRLVAQNVVRVLNGERPVTPLNQVSDSSSSKNPTDSGLFGAL